ncbi:zinc finger MYM-type protein 1-like isoform X1 [Gymnodraco acuticeps]|uniref:Zinc finger MYM-type protein 1-like isoform X1 n=1 Tax=Gymnodraco acuticeps TaxID=8218 RepID=A0A6P8UIG4_GYMAC|nr:zinc finger MYM-type protein 1-like isoform X1 [Gymnodraco acuticeps]
MRTVPFTNCGTGLRWGSRHVNGVQTKLRQDHPSAIYIHCMAHKLNLVLVDACKSNHTAMGFFLTLESLYTFFAQPGTHHAYKQRQNELGVKAELTALSDTRWACRWKNVSAVKDSMEALISTLSELSVPPYRRFVEASGLLNAVRSADFCVSLIIFHQLLSKVHVTHKALQGKETILSKAASVIESMMKCFENMRATSQKCEDIWIEIQAFCQSVGVCIEENDERPCKRPVKQPSALDCAFVTSTLGQREYQTSTDKNSLKNKWAIQLYYPVLDTLLGECSTRFSPQSMAIAESVDAVFKCDFRGAESLLSQYASLLSINPKLALTEMTMVTTKLPSVSVENIKKELATGHYPNFIKLFCLALSLPVGTATCERSFSTMQRIRNWLRTTMHQERLTTLSLLHIESNLTEKIKAEDIIDAYDATAKRCILLH